MVEGKELELSKISVGEFHSENPISRDDMLKDWERIRGLIEHEDCLINHRMTWLIAVNAFLFTGYFLSQRSLTDGNVSELAKSLLWLIPISGALISLTIQRAISAAMNQILHVNRWWIWRKSLDSTNYSCDKSDIKGLNHPKISGINPGSFLDHDFLISTAIPAYLIITWIAILAAVFWEQMKEDISIPFWGVTLVIVFLLTLKVLHTHWIKREKY